MGLKYDLPYHDSPAHAGKSIKAAKKEIIRASKSQDFYLQRQLVRAELTMLSTATFSILDPDRDKPIAP